MWHVNTRASVSRRTYLQTKRRPLAALSTAAHIDERKQVLPLLKALGSWKREGTILEADQGYITKRLREQIQQSGIYSAIRQRGKPSIGRSGVSIIWKIEGTFANLKRRYKRFGHRWEKKKEAWLSLVSLALIGYWSGILAK